MKKLILDYPPEFGNLLQPLALELIMALSTRDDLYGKLDVTDDGEEKTLHYRNLEEAMAMLSHYSDITLLSIMDDHFSLLLDQVSEGLELDIALLDPDRPEVFEEIQTLARNLLDHLIKQPRL